MRKDYIKDQWCVWSVFQQPYLKEAKFTKLSILVFFFLTKIGSLVNFIVRNVIMEVDKYEEVECKKQINKYIYIYDDDEDDEGMVKQDD